MRAPGRPPAPGTALVGRASDLAAVADLLTTTRLVTLTGPPGVGKTRLALETAAAIAERFDDGVTWVDLTPVDDARQVAGEIAGTVELDFDPEVLLILDNCEHVLDAAPEIAELLTRSTRLRILATSRERLRLSAEREYAVPPLPMPGEPEIRDWAALRMNPAVRMLLARAPAGITLTPQTSRSLAEICIRLDGLPLALELAAARLRLFTPAELAFRLEHQRASLSGGARDAPARHRDLRAAIAWSYDLLSDRDRRVFRRLAVFPNDWTITDAGAVCNEPDVEDAVESLLEKNLVRRVGHAEDGQARFAMFVSLREFAAEQLSDAERELARDRHVAYFAGKAREWEVTVGTADENATWTKFSMIRADLRTAFEHSRAGNDPDATLWLATAIGWYHFTHGDFADTARLVDVIAGASVDDRASAEARAAALLIAGVLSYSRRDADGAKDALVRTSEIARTRGDDRRRAIATAFLGHLARDRGDFDEARACYEITRGIYAGQRNVRGLAWAEHDAGLLSSALHRYDEAIVELRDAVRLFEQLDYPWAVASALRALADALLHTGAVDESAVALRRALDLHSGAGDRRGIAECLEVLADVAFERRAAARAARLVGAAQTQRERGAAPPNDLEQERLNALTGRLSTALGASTLDHQRHAGRTMPYPAVLELADSVVGSAGEAEAPVQLTGRQWEVAELVAAGNTNRQIGRHLGISERTTEIHVRNIMTRTGTSSRAGIAAWLVRNQTVRTT